MKLHVLSYFVILVFLLTLDALWLGLMLPRFYKSHLAHLITENPQILPAIIFYLLYSFGIYFFVVRHSISQNWDILSTFGVGALLGVIAYATYDLTNQTTLPRWPAVVTIVDIIWGAFLTGIVAFLSTWVSKKFFI